MKNSILIIGASGQLGRFFIDKLSKNNRVLATDISGESSLNCDFEYLDVLNIENLRSIVKNYKINRIYNLAAILSAKGEDDLFKTWNLNTEAFLNVSKVAIEFNVERIFWPSSIAVFGHNSNLDFVENDVPMLPSSIYGVSKLASEKLMYYLNTKKLLDIRSLRYPGIASASKPGGGTTDYIVEMLYSALSNKKYTCFLNKNNNLPMIHIDDSIDAAIELMEADKKMISINYPYNINGFSMNPGTWNNIINDLGYDLKTDYKPDFRDLIANSWPKDVNDSLFRNDFNWSPKFNSVETAQNIMASIQPQRQ